MSNLNPKLSTTLRLSPVIPVLVIDRTADAVPLARALLAGGLKVLEVTLRTPVALDIIEVLARQVPEAVVAAGTVTNPRQWEQAARAGAKFMVSPGLTPALIEAALENGLKTLFILVAISFGLAIPPLIIYRNRPII